MIVLENILSQEIIQKLGWTLVHFIWQAAVVALLLAVLLRVLRKSTANVRYIFACLALGLIVLLPLITIQLIPAWLSRSAVHIEPLPVPMPPILPAEAGEEMPVAQTPVLERAAPLEGVGTVSTASWKQRTTELLEPALPYIVLGWLVGVFGLSVWHLGGWAQSQRLRRKMVKQADPSLYSKLQELAKRLGVNRAVQLVESALVQIPTVVGWLRPVILLPASALTGLSTHQLEAILAHELAHIKRFDYLVNMLQTVVEILGFYHPAVWWVSHRIRAERENCCDDLAVSISGDRVCYAGALASMEEIRAGWGQLAVAASGANLFRRIYRLVGKDSADKTSSSCIPAVTVILLIVALVIPTLAWTERTNQKSGTQIELGGKKIALEEILAKYEKHRNAAPTMYALVVKNPHNLYVTYQDKLRIFRAKYAFGSVYPGEQYDEQVAREDRAASGESMESMLAWASKKTPENLEVWDGRYSCSLWRDRDGHLKSRSKIKGRMDSAFLKTLQNMGWPEIVRPKSNRRLVPSDRYARDNGLVCIEEKQKVISSRKGEITHTTRFYLNPERDLICQRKHETDYKYAEEVTKYGQTEDGLWYPLQVSEFGDRYMSSVSPGNQPRRINRVYLNTKPDFPTGIFDLDALAERIGLEQESAEQLRLPVDPSAEKLKRLGLAVIMYADEHDKNLPDGLQVLKPYIANEQDLQWIVNHVEYFGKDKRYQPNQPRIAIAYDKTLLGKATGTNVLFMDGHVEFLTPERFNKLVRAVKRMEPDKTPGRLVDNSAFFTPPITRIINSIVERKDCFIDFDNDKIYSPPSDFYSRDRQQQKYWRRENGIDASVTVSESAEGLWGEEMVIIPLHNVDFDRMTPASFRDFLRQATPGTPAVMTAIGELPKTYVFKTREDGMGLLQILEVQRKQKPNYIKIRYKMVPRTADSDAKITSNKKLQDLGKAMVFFAQDHQRKLPDSLQDFAPYLRNKQDIEWLSQNVEYLGKGKTEKDRPDTVIAYDKPLLKLGQGTNVLFLDAHVEYVQADQLKKLDISSEIEKRVESAKKLSNLGKGLLIYANDYEDKYPDSLPQLREYLKDEELKWALTNVKYLAKGKTITVPPNTPIAYDKTPLAEGTGTNVLFNDSHVEFVKTERLKELGIGK